MESILRGFYNNEGEREAVKGFLVEMLGEIAIERAFDGKDTKGIQEARECVERAFDRLEEKYGKIKKPIAINSR